MLEQAQRTARRWRPLFWIAAGYNFVGSAGGIVAPALFNQSFFTAPAPQFDAFTSLHVQAFWVSVLLFGIGYAIVAMKPTANRGIVWLAMVGKLYVGILFGIFWLQGHLSIFIFLGGLGDILFAACFFLFLFQTRALARVKPALLL